MLLSPIINIPRVVVSSILEHPLAAQIKVSPNPTDGLINIAFDLPQRMEVAPEIFNALGELVVKLPRQWVLKGGIQTAIKGVGAGIYFVKVGFEGGVVVKRVLVVR